VGDSTVTVNFSYCWFHLYTVLCEQIFCLLFLVLYEYCLVYISLCVGEQFFIWEICLGYCTASWTSASDGA